MLKIHHATMTNNVIPTDNAYHSAVKNVTCINGNTAKQEPTKNPTKCPPMILLGCAVILLGMEKTMNAVEPMLAITTGLLYKRNVIMKMDIAA